MVKNPMGFDPNVVHVSVPYPSDPSSWYIYLLRGDWDTDWFTGYMQVYNPRIWGHITHENRGFFTLVTIHLS